jgi:hypothetical protein
MDRVKKRCFLTTGALACHGGPIQMTVVDTTETFRILWNFFNFFKKLLDFYVHIVGTLLYLTVHGGENNAYKDE